MKTTEQAIRQIEDAVSGMYAEAFPESPLRTDTRGNIELLKLYFQTLAVGKTSAARSEAFENILRTVLDRHPLPESWQKDGIADYMDRCRENVEGHKLMKFPLESQKLAKICDEVITRLEEDEKSDDEMSVGELSRKYEGKWLYFNGDEDGSEWVWVKNIHRHRDIPILCVDGVMVSHDAQDYKFTVLPVEDKNFSEFYYFKSDDEDWDGFTSCSKLDKALMSKPVDTDMSTHVMEGKEVVDDILTYFGWVFASGWGTEVPGMQELFTGAMYSRYGKPHGE